MKVNMNDLDRFANEVLIADQFNLARAALIMGEFEYPNLDASLYLNQLDHLANSARYFLNQGRSDSQAVDLAYFLFDRLGFSGNHDQYHDPKNSFVNEVMDRRLGIPITLSLVYLEIARRIDIEVEGVGLPGHFIVRARKQNFYSQPSYIYLDPFNRGALMTVEQCRERVNILTEGKLTFQMGYLNPVGPRHILTRMLNNLKNIYASQNDLERTLAIIERLLILNPLDPAEMRNQATVYISMGERMRAIKIYERYLDVYPNAPDFKKIEQSIIELATEISKWN
jgi:regulator of sirC expression with transglutaminase-like and TPR domain